MYKLGIVLLAFSYAAGSPLSQEELAQYVARQQTVGLPRRQAYLLPQGGAAASSGPQPRQLKPQYQQAPQYQAPQQQYQPHQYQQDEAPQYYQPHYVQQSKARPGPRPLLKGQNPEEDEDYDPNPQYQFAFDIKDDEFTNYQNRNEQREGNVISGSYSVVDSDGYIRTVKYTADPKEGFKADVIREPTDIKIKIPVPTQLVPQQYQYQPSLRKQQAQQYLQASSPVERQQYSQGQAYQAAQPKQLAYQAPQLQTRYQAKGPSYQQEPSPSPIVYQPYQQ